MRKLPEKKSVLKAIKKIKAETYKDSKGEVCHRKPIAVKMSPECSANLGAPDKMEGLPVLIKRSLSRPFVIAVEMIKDKHVLDPYEAI